MTTKKITSMGKSLNKERTGSQSSCDFTITCGNREFKVHKCVMGLISEYFKKMFTSSQPAANQEKTVLKDIEADSMEMLLDYVYNDESVIKEDNVYEILEVAEFFQIPSVKTDCDQFLQAHISIFNCLRHWMMARKFSLNVSWYHDYVSKHFGTIMTFGEGLKIDFSHFNSLLKMKRQGSSIDRKNSLMSFQIMWRWVKYDIVERKQYFRALFSQVNLKWVSCKIMQKELDDELLSEFPDCAAKLREALELYKPCSSYDLHSVNHIKFLYPNPENKMFDDENFYFKDFTEFNEHSLVVAKDEIIYSIGGRNGGQSKSLFGVRRLNPHRMQLGVCRDLNFGRRNAGCAIYKDSIYVAGGLEHDSFTQSSVEYLSNNESCWKFKQGMDMQREGLSLVAYEDTLYAISGRPRPSEVTNTVECFDGETWKFVASINQERYHFAAVSLGGCIYAIGGETFGQNCNSRYRKRRRYTQVLSSMEAYDTFSDTWRNVASLHMARSGHSACAWKGKIYVVGGVGDNNSWTEMYNPTADKWEYV